MADWTGPRIFRAQETQSKLIQPIYPPTHEDSHWFSSLIQLTPSFVFPPLLALLILLKWSGSRKCGFQKHSSSHRGILLLLRQQDAARHVLRVVMCSLSGHTLWVARGLDIRWHEHIARTRAKSAVLRALHSCLDGTSCSTGCKRVGRHGFIWRVADGTGAYCPVAGLFCWQVYSALPGILRFVVAFAEEMLDNEGYLGLTMVDTGIQYCMMPEEKLMRQ